MSSIACPKCGSLLNRSDHQSDHRSGRATCAGCGARLYSQEEADQDIVVDWKQTSISMLGSAVFHMFLMLSLALVTLGGRGVAGDGTGDFIGRFRGDNILGEPSEEELTVVEPEYSAHKFGTEQLEEVEPTTMGTAMISEGGTGGLQGTPPSSIGSSDGDLDFGSNLPSAGGGQGPGGGGGGGGGSWEGMIRQLRKTGLDIAIVFDSTGSMTGEIDQVKNQIERIGKILFKIVPDTQISLCTFRDEGDDYVVRGIPLTNDLQKLTSFLDTVYADAGGDSPEAVHSGLSWSIENNQFRSRARKVILIFGDAPPHDEFLQRCLQLAGDFRRSQQGIVSTVTCRGAIRLHQFVDIANAGGGEAFMTSDERQIMTQLMVLVFGSKHKQKVVEAFRLMER